VSSSVQEIEKFGLATDYYKNYDKNVRALTLQDAKKVSSQLISPDKLTWFVVGDKEKIMEGLKGLNFSEIVVIDADGNPVKPAPTTIKSGNN
jgi:zinc protease